MSDRPPCSVQYTRCTLQSATQIAQRTTHAIHKATHTMHSLVNPHPCCCAFVRLWIRRSSARFACLLHSASILGAIHAVRLSHASLSDAPACGVRCACASQAKARLHVPFLWPICVVACRVCCAVRWRPMALCACLSDARCFTQVATWLTMSQCRNLSQHVASRAYHIATAQVLVSIQGLVLVEQPFYNEPGYEKQVLPVHAHPQRGEAQRTSRSNRIVACCVLHIVFGACCMLRAACCMLHVACSMFVFGAWCR